MQGAWEEMSNCVEQWLEDRTEATRPHACSPKQLQRIATRALSSLHRAAAEGREALQQVRNVAAAVLVGGGPRRCHRTEGTCAALAMC